MQNLASAVKIVRNTVAPPLSRRSAIDKASKKVEQDGYTIYVPKEKDSVKSDLIELYKSLDLLFGNRIVRVKGPLTGDVMFNSYGNHFDLVMNRYKKDIVEGSFSEKDQEKKERLESLRILLDPELFYLNTEINDVTVTGINSYEELFRLGAENIYENFHEKFDNKYKKYAFHEKPKNLMQISELTEIVKQTYTALKNQLEKAGVEPTSNNTGVLAEFYVNQASPAIKIRSQLKSLLNEESDFFTSLVKEGVTYEHLCVFYANDHYPRSIEDLKEYATLPIDWLEMILSGRE